MGGFKEKNKEDVTRAAALAAAHNEFSKETTGATKEVGSKNPIAEGVISNEKPENIVDFIMRDAAATLKAATDAVTTTDVVLKASSSSGTTREQESEGHITEKEINKVGKSGTSEETKAQEICCGDKKGEGTTEGEEGTEVSIGVKNPHFIEEARSWAEGTDNVGVVADCNTNIGERSKMVVSNRRVSGGESMRTRERHEKNLMVEKTDQLESSPRGDGRNESGMMWSPGRITGKKRCIDFSYEEGRNDMREERGERIKEIGKGDEEVEKGEDGGNMIKKVSL